MGNPLLSLTTAPFGRRSLRRVVVEIPTDIPSTDAIFLVLRRMRTPMILLIVVFAISVAGLAAIPGIDDTGKAYRMSVFDAFYVMSYTATTIGFGEIPHTFTAAQRLWVTGAIFGTVLAWAYSIGALFALLQDNAFQDALYLQQFGRRVRRMHEPFYIVAGYGHAGRTIVQSMDATGHRMVVVDRRRARIEQLLTEELIADVPGLAADVSRPAVLGLAGLGHKHCAGVLAVTNDDDTNLAVVMAVHLLRPGLPVIARCADRGTAEHMLDFAPDAIINPYDRYGDYLTLALRRPVTSQVLSWLMSPVGSAVPQDRGHLRQGRWIVYADGRFGVEVMADFRRVGLDVTQIEPDGRDPDVSGVTGLVAGAESDTQNLATAAHARRLNADIFLSVRQESHVTASLLAAFDFDSVFVPTEVVAREALARVATPLYWSFIAHVETQPEDWAQNLLAGLLQRCGPGRPGTVRVPLDTVDAPAVCRWLRDRPLSLGDLLRHPDDRAQPLPILALALVREGRTQFLPEEDTALRVGDQLLLAVRSQGLHALSSTLFHDAVLEYLATGVSVPSTWVWRRLTGSRGSRRRAS